MPDYYESASNNVESKAFDKFLGEYVELPVDDGESTVLDRVKEPKRDHNCRLIGT